MAGQTTEFHTATFNSWVRGALSHHSDYCCHLYSLSVGYSRFSPAPCPGASKDPKRTLPPSGSMYFSLSCWPDLCSPPVLYRISAQFCHIGFSLYIYETPSSFLCEEIFKKGTNGAQLDIHDDKGVWKKLSHKHRFLSNNHVLIKKKWKIFYESD